MIAQNLIIEELVRFERDTNKFMVTLNHWSGFITIPIIEAQARLLVAAAHERSQITNHSPTQFGRSSCQFRHGNRLTAVLNETGDPDCLLSMVTYGRDEWLVWLGGEGATFRVLSAAVGHRILSSARSQSSRTYPTVVNHSNGRYLFIQPNTFAACLRPKTETSTDGRLDIEDATAAHLHQRLTAVWRNAALS